MLYEYAVDPEVTRHEVTEVRHLFALFGLDRGRYISNFPKREWFRKAYAAASNHEPVAKKAIEELLVRAKSSKVFANGRVPDPALDWMGNTLISHATRPFQAIISDNADPAFPEIISFGDVHEEHARFQCERSRRIQRTEADLAYALLPMAMIGKRLALIDPFLDLRNQQGQNYRTMIGRLLAELSASGRENIELELHWRSHSSRPPEALVLSDAPAWCAGLIPPGFRLVLHEWNQRPGGEDIHDRFFLTEAGGINVGAGFSVVGAHQRVQLSLLAASDVQSHLDDLDRNNGPFDLAFRPVVVECDGTTHSL